MNAAYVLIDIQNDYFPGGKMALQGSPQAAENAARLLQFFRQRNAAPVHVQHITTRPGATFFIPGTPGAEIYTAVRPQEGESVVVKHFPNAFRETDLLDILRRQNADTLVVAGMMTHMCVDTSVRAASDLGFSCLIAHDACATLALSYDGREVNAQDVQAAYMAALDGSFGQVLSTDQILERLSRAVA